MPTTVLVTGASGYIAQHIVVQLVAAGYNVIGTVRSTKKGDALKANVPKGFSYEVVEDIAAEGAFDDVFKKHKEITIVLHTASPFNFSATDPDKGYLIPALDGTKNVLKSVHEYAPQVTRVVVTSSYAAVGDFSKDNDPSVTFTEKSWNPQSWEEGRKNNITAYIVSKSYAEKAAWDFVEENKPKFKLSTVNPTYVFGPQAFDSEVRGTLGTSAEIINSILKLKPGENVNEASGAWIDVRDVAKAHLAAFEKEEAIGQRLVLRESRFTHDDLLKLILSNFPQFKGKISEESSGARPQFAVLDFSHTDKLLGFKYITLEQSVIDSIKQIIANQ